MKVGDLVKPGVKGNGLDPTTGMVVRGHNLTWVGLIVEVDSRPIGYYIRVLWNDGVEKLHLRHQIRRCNDDID